jgi:micrococcal nuclease
VRLRLGPRRRAKGWFVLLLLLFLTVTFVSGLPYFVAGEDARRPEAEEQRTALTLPPGVRLDDLVEAEVTDVIDGDTIDVRIEGRFERVRYFGVDTPERGDRCYREALDRNEQLLGESVLLLADSRDRDSFGRSLRYVFLADGTSVDATLVAEGFGWAWREDGRYRDDLVGFESQAEAADRGCLWG